MLIIMSGASVALITFNRDVERVTDFTAATMVMEGELERVRTNRYQPPVTPFTAGTVSWTNNVTLALDRAGSNYLQTARLLTTTRPVANGHLVTVSLTFSNAFRPTNLWLQTVVNQYSAGQP
jgi:hypothetical protein